MDLGKGTEGSFQGSQEPAHLIRCSRPFWSSQRTHSLMLCLPGAVLSHRMVDGSEKPIAFALSSAEKRYAQLEKEGLAIIFGVKHFHQYLYGRRFIINSDHKPLKHLFSKGRPIPNWHQLAFNAGHISSVPTTTVWPTAQDQTMPIQIYSVDYLYQKHLPRYHYLVTPSCSWTHWKELQL